LRSGHEKAAERSGAPLIRLYLFVLMRDYAGVTVELVIVSTSFAAIQSEKERKGGRKKKAKILPF